MTASYNVLPSALLVLYDKNHKQELYVCDTKQLEDSEAVKYRPICGKVEALITYDQTQFR